MVAACRYQGMSAQEAFDHLDSMLHDCYADFEDAASRLPSWGPAVDQEVRRYVEGLKNCVRSNLSFSFRSHRYFGDRRDAVKASGKIDVLERPAYLDGR